MKVGIDSSNRFGIVKRKILSIVIHRPESFSETMFKSSPKMIYKNANRPPTYRTIFKDEIKEFTEKTEMFGLPNFVEGK